MRYLTISLIIFTALVLITPGQSFAFSVNIDLSGEEEVSEAQNGTSTIESAIKAWEVLSKTAELIGRMVKVVAGLITNTLRIVNDAFERFIGISLLDFVMGLWRLLVWVVGLITGALESILGTLEGVSV